MFISLFMPWNNVWKSKSTLVKDFSKRTLVKVPSLKQLLNNKESGFIIESPQSFSNLIDISLCPRGLLEFKHCINSGIFIESISTVPSLLEVLEVRIDGRMLLFGIGWHCLPKKLLKIFALSLKLVTSFLWASTGVVTETFLPLTRILIIE